MNIDEPFRPENLAGTLPAPVDGLPALVSFVRRAMSADAVIAFEAGSDGLAMPLAVEPQMSVSPFSLSSTRLHTIDWSDGPVAADRLHLPSSIIIGLDRPVHQALFVAAPVADAPMSGILLLWLSNSPRLCDCSFRTGISDHIGFLAPVFAQMLGDRRTLTQRRITNERFHDLLGSVPTGIVLLEGNGHSGLVNKHAAVLLGIMPGEFQSVEIALPMQKLRAGCRNTKELDVHYAPLQHNLDFASRAIWEIGSEKYEVDTHPILGNGRNGRIWLFDNVTAQHLVEENLRQLALTDALTGLDNRRRFFSAGTALFEQTPSPLACLMIDIDHFKKINDTYGHPFGDEVLRVIAARMKNVLREYDLLARLGGEEFGILLDGLAPETINDTAERLRRAIADVPVKMDSTIVDVRVSVGVAIRTPSDGTLDQLLARADAALYSAKTGGRNRVVFAAMPGS